MAKIHILRSLVTERLAAAAEEIFRLFERTLTEYEGEIDRQRKLLQHLKPEIKTDSLHPKLLVCEEEDPSEQQERSPSLDQEESEPPQIKEEQEELWSSQEGEQLQGLEEAEVKWTSTPVPVKREHDEEEPQCSWFNQTQPEESREAEPLPRTSTEHMETQPGGDDWAAPEPARTSRPAVGSKPTRDVHLLSSDSSGAETKDSDEWEEMRRAQSGLKTQKSSQQTLSSMYAKLYEKYFAEEKPFTCSECGKGFKWKLLLERHMTSHSDEKPYGCSVCGKKFTQRGTVKTHMRTHTNEKPYRCPLCDKAFRRNNNLTTHLRTHTNERPYSCSICGRGFGQKGNLQTHIRTHTNDKPFSCSLCGKKFTRSINLKTHMKLHLV